MLLSSVVVVYKLYMSYLPIRTVSCCKLAMSRKVCKRVAFSFFFLFLSVSFCISLICIIFFFFKIVLLLIRNLKYKEKLKKTNGKGHELISTMQNIPTNKLESNQTYVYISLPRLHGDKIFSSPCLFCGH